MYLCTDIVTVFNHGMDDDGMDVYYPTVISGVSWHCDTAASVDSSHGLSLANRVTVRIPETADFGGKTYAEFIPIVSDDLEYILTAEGDTLVANLAFTDADGTEQFTLAVGDVLAHGIYDEALTYSEINAIPERMVILSVTDNRRAKAPHWKVIGQ